MIKLPEPTIIDGRRLYTAGDMRAYAKACVDEVMGEEAPNDKPSESDAVNKLFKAFGMKK